MASGSIASLLADESLPLLGQRMADMFDGLESDFEAYGRSVSNLVADIGRAASEAERHQLTAEAEQDLEEADRCVHSMAMEARALDHDTRQVVDKLIRRYESELKGLRDELKRARARGERDALLSGHDAEAQQARYANQLDRVDHYTQKADRTTQLLSSARQTVHETEEVGQHVIADLVDQRGSLQRTKEHVGTTKQHASRARKLLNAMQRRSATNRCILWTVIALLVILILLVLWMWYIPH